LLLEERWQRHDWRACQLQAASRTASCRLSQCFREISRGRPDPIDALKLFESEMEDIVRLFQDANVSQAATKLEQRPTQDRHRQRQCEVRVLT
jgi:hypothetical protein